MKTLTADKWQRVRIPGAKPKQKFAFADNGDGTLTLTAVNADIKEAFPRGSLKYLCTSARNKDLEQIAAGTILGVPKDYDK